MDHRESSHRLPCLSCARRTLNICKPLDDGLLAQMLQLGGLRHWNKREILFHAGDRQGPFFKITRGIVAVSRTLDDGRRQIVGLRAPGDCVGYLETDGRYDFEGEALTPVEACAFDRQRFDIFAKRHPEVTVAIATALSSKLTKAGQNMLVIGRLKSTEKVANFLVALSDLYADRLLPTHPLALHLTRSEIADYLGLTLETVSRSFGKLKNRHVIALVESDAVVILDRTRLVEIAKSAA